MSPKVLPLVTVTLLALGLALPLACGGGTAPTRLDGGNGCGPCPAGQGCDLSNKSCVPGATEGARCGPEAAVGAPLVCVDGLVCSGVPDGRHICVVTLPPAPLVVTFNSPVNGLNLNDIKFSLH